MATPSRPKPGEVLHRLVAIAPGEGRATALSFAYFLFVLASWYTLRPVRDALAVGAGVENMGYLFGSTFLVMLAIVPLYGWLLSRFPRRRILPLVYVFFGINILLFRGWFEGAPEDPWLGRLFFVWASVFNLFVVSVFWSFMAEVWNRDQSRRLFGLIAAGGSVGALVGPVTTSAVVERAGLPMLMVVSAALLAVALALQLLLMRGAEDRAIDSDARQPMGGDILAGARLMLAHPFLARVGAFMFLGTLTGAMLYVLQARVISEHFETAAVVTGVFARIDLAVNLATILVQVTLTARILGWLGLALTLAVLPAVVGAGFAAITLAPVLGVIVAAQVLRRSLLFGVTNPVSQTLYTVVGPQSKYKFKHFCDTVVYRGGDTSGVWLITGLFALGAGLPVAAICGMVLATLWASVGVSLGRRFNRMSRNISEGGARLP